MNSDTMANIQKQRKSNLNASQVKTTVLQNMAREFLNGGKIGKNFIMNVTLKQFVQKWHAYSHMKDGWDKS